MQRSCLLLLATIAVFGALSGCENKNVASKANPKEAKPKNQVEPEHQPASLNGAGGDRSLLAGLKVQNLKGRAFVIEDFGAPSKGDALAVINSLEKRAAAGDAKAALDIYLKTNECLQVKKSSSVGKVATASQETLDGCQSLTEDKYAGASHWLDVAASEGNLAAQLLYSSDPEAILGDASEVLRDPQKAQEYKSKAMAYLHDAASLGSVDAMLRLGNAYWAGVLVDRDYRSSYAYYEAVKNVDPELIPKNRMDYLAQELRADQMVSATNQGMVIYEKCCQVQ